MKLHYKYKNIDYILTDDGHKVGDKVYPIGMGRSSSFGYVHDEFDFRPFMSGWPDEPHTVVDTNDLNYPPNGIRTNHGYGPKEMYFRVLLSIDKKDYEVKEWNISKFGKKKAVNSIIVYDKLSHSSALVIRNGKVLKHIGIPIDWLTKEEIEKIKSFFSAERPGIIRPSCFDLNKVLNN